VDPSGSKQVCPTATTIYTISVAGAGGSQTAATTVTVIPLSKKTVVFDAVALFDFDKADLKPEGKAQIKAYREEAKAELSRADKITITGYTDNVGTADYNMKLSLRRAEAVRDYVISLGIDPNKLEVKGEGMSNPMADNSTEEGRAKNRRVEVEITGVEK
jgi:OOP family OmpA-OmpF porin